MIANPLLPNHITHWLDCGIRPLSIGAAAQGESRASARNSRFLLAVTQAHGIPHRIGNGQTYTCAEASSRINGGHAPGMSGQRGSNPQLMRVLSIELLSPCTQQHPRRTCTGNGAASQAAAEGDCAYQILAPPSADLAAAIVAAERFVRSELLGNDASHDFWHIERVRRMALRLAAEEGITGHDLQVVHLAALLHDVGDWKYSGSAAAGPKKIEAWLEGAAVEAAVQMRVLRIIACVGFKDELAAGGSPEQSTPLETAAVQDADRLDAIGAIGIARCFTYGGAKARVLHDPAVFPSAALTQQEYTDSRREQTTINHFHEKLLKLKGMMKTAAGRRIAEKRHAFMTVYLDEFQQEWDAAA